MSIWARAMVGSVMGWSVLAPTMAACEDDAAAPSTSVGASGTGASSTGAQGAGAGATTGSGARGGAGGMDAGGISWDTALDPDAGPSSTRLTEHPLGSGAATQGFYAYLPPGYPGGAKWPLLVALHGVGENGNGQSGELDKVIGVGIGKLIASDTWPNERPFVVLMPQHSSGGCPDAAEIDTFIAYGMENYEIDVHAVHLTGLSCGAIGGWTYLAQHLDAQIAAFVPVAGDGKAAWSSQGCALGAVPIWAFHGDADPTVDVSGTNVPMDGLAGCPSPPAQENKKTIYRGVDHDAWDRTYDLSAGHDIYEWMLGKSKP